MILYATLALCAGGAALSVYRHDLFDRKPTWLLALSVGLGALTVALAGRGVAGARDARSESLC